MLGWCLRDGWLGEFVCVCVWLWWGVVVRVIGIS